MSLCRNATRHDIGGFKHCSSMFDLVLQTPSELAAKGSEATQQQKDKFNVEHDMMNEEYIGSDIFEMFGAVLTEAKKSDGNYKILKSSLNDVIFEEGIHHLFKTAQKSKSIKDLPEVFQKTFTIIHQHWAPKLLIQSLDTQSKVNKWKAIYHLAPRR